MNKRCYRLVFNRVRQRLRVVSELARSQGGGGGRVHNSGFRGLNALCVVLHPLSLPLMVAGGAVAVPAVASEIYVDKHAPKGQQPTLQRSDNGLPQIDIQTPNKQGVSHNSYTQFDVDKRGVVLNNSRKRSRTQLAGMMAANPWLAKGEAKVILNEINSRNPSQLTGYIEVAGKKADVIIANPAGITCAGCGFINSGKNVLAAAKARVDSGLVTGFDVDRGKVVIAGQGMDSRGQDYTALIARAVEVNAKVQANQLQVTTGRNRTDADGRIVSVQEDDPAGRPAFALDVAALGGMYANKITLVGSEHGVGVRNAGELGASGGKLGLSTAGKLTNSGTLSGRDGVDFNVKEIDNRGQLLSQGDLQLHHQGDFTNTGIVRTGGKLGLDIDGTLHNTASGQLIAGGDNQISAGSLQGDSGSVFAAGIDSQGNATQAGSLSLTSRGTLASQGMHLSHDNVRITADTLDLSGSHSQGNQVSLTARKQAIRTDNAAINAKQLTLTTPSSLSNRGGSLSADKLVLNTPDFIDNRQGALAQRGQDMLHIRTQRIDNSQGKLVSQGALTVTTPTLINRSGQLGSQGGLSLQTNAIDNTQGIITSAGGNVDMHVNGALTNPAGTIQSANSLRLNANSLDNSNQGALLAAAGTLAMDVEGAINNTHGTITGRGDITSRSQSLTNTAGRISSVNGGMTVTTRDGVTNQNGRLESAKDLTLQATHLTNTQGTLLSSGGNITAKVSGVVNNRDGRIAAQQGVTLHSAHLDNRDGTVQSTGGQVDIVSQQVNNDRGTVSAKGRLAIQATVSNPHGRLLAQDIALITGELNNAGGLIQGTGHVAINTQGNRVINSGTQGDTTGIRAGEQLTLNTGDIANDRGLLAADTLVLNSASLNNQGGVINSASQSTLTTQTVDNSQQGKIQSGGNLDINSQGAAVNNQTGTLQANAALTLTNISQLDNQNGTVQGNNGVVMQADTLSNDSGNVLSGGDIQATLGTLNNVNGRLFAAGNAVLNARDRVLNNQGLLKANQALMINTAVVDNQHTRASGTGIEANTLTLHADTVQNSTGAMRAANTLWADIALTLNNQSGLLSSQDSLTISQRGGNRLVLNNQAGSITADNQADITAHQIDSMGDITSRGTLTLTTDSHLTQDGTLLAKDLTLNANGGITHNGLTSGSHSLTLNTPTLDNLPSGEISGGSVTMNAGHITNRGLFDGDLLRINTGQLDNLGTGRIYGDDIRIDARTLNNLKEEDNAAVIAGRNSVNIATDILTNQDHALIYSDGDLMIGGQMAGNGDVSGLAQRVDNLSATIEAMGNLTIAADTLNNNDIYVKLGEMQEISAKQTVEFELCRGKHDKVACNSLDGQRYHFPVHYDAKKGRYVLDFDENGNSFAINDDGSINHDISIYKEQGHLGKQLHIYDANTDYDGKHFIQYEYKTHVAESTVTDADPAKIRSGKDILLNGNVNNASSQIVAGGALVQQGGKLDNTELQGERHTWDEGMRYSYYRHDTGSVTWKTRIDGRPYQGTDTTETLPQHLIPIQQHVGQLSGQTLDGRQGHNSNPAGQVQQEAGTLSDGNLTAHIIDIPLSGLQDGNTQLNGQAGQLHIKGAPGTPSGIPLDNPWVVRSLSGVPTLPDSSLFSLHPGGGSGYLVETDKRFTREKTWLSSSDVYREANSLHKRLGDGYYEQRLVRDQLIETTGQRFLDGQDNDEDQYRMLLTNGKAFGEAFNITPGVALSAEQMANLTSDIVWMVNQTVTLPDGSTETVSVPKLYVRVKAGEVTGQGALIAGNRVRIDSDQHVKNSGVIAGREMTAISADSLLNQGTISGNHLSILANENIINQGGQLIGGDSLNLIAGNDILSLTEGRQNGQERWLDKTAGIVTQNDNSVLSLQAGHDIRLTASQISNNGDNGTTTLIAGNNITLNSQTISHATDYSKNKKNYSRTTDSEETGSQIQSAGNLTLQAGNDVNLHTANVNADSALTVLAGHDIILTAGTQESTLDARQHKKTHSGGLFGSTTTRDKKTHSDSRTAQSTTLTGDSVTLLAGNDITAQAGNLVASQNVALQAGNDISLTTADEADHYNSVKKKKKSGFSGTGGLGFSVGTRKQKATHDEDSNVQKGSTLGSTHGNVTLTAGNQLNIHGSDVVAGKDILLSGKDVNITAAENSHTELSTWETKSSGLTVSLGGSVGSALNTAVHTAKSARHENDSRLAALKGTQAALQGMSAIQAERLDAAQGNPASNNNTLGVNIGYGSSRAKSSSKREQSQASSSHITAGNALDIIARGDTSLLNKQNSNSGDININGGILKAGGNTTLTAARDITLLSAANTDTLSGKSNSHGSSAGISAGLGRGGASNGAYASADKSNGHEKGDTLTHTETTIDSGGSVTINSGQDTTLQGAQVNGNSIIANIGRNLTLQSEQDSNDYHSKKTHQSGGLSASQGLATSGLTGGSVSLDGKRNTLNSTYASVHEQTGLFAGNGGFDITVGNHTQLNGAVISSTADPSKNSLSTGTLGFSDMENSARYKVKHDSIGVSTGGNIGGQFGGSLPNDMLVGYKHSDSKNSTTHAAISEGTITIRDPANQTQDISQLSRDTVNANNVLNEIFDKEKEQKRLDRVQAIGEITRQTADIVRTEGAIAGEKAKTDPTKRSEAQRQLEAEGKAVTEQSISQRAYDNAQRSTGTGSSLQAGITAAGNVVMGLASGNWQAAIADGAAPYIAQQIHSMTTNPKTGEVDTTANLTAHAIVNAALAIAKGGGATAAGVQAAGAVSGEATAIIASDLYGKKPSELTESEKQTVSALSTLAGGLAGGLIGNNTSSANAGAMAGKVSSDNNALANVLGALEANKAGTVETWKEERHAAIKEACSGGTPISCQTMVATASSVLALPLLPGSAQAMWLLGAGTNAGMQYADSGEINPINSVAAGWINVITMGQGWKGTIAWNAAGGALTNAINGDDPLTGAITNGAGAGFGYGVGNYVVKPIANTAGKWITGGWNPKFDPTLLKYTEVKGQLGISKEMVPSKIPGAAGNMGASITSEMTGTEIQKVINDKLKKGEPE